MATNMFVTGIPNATSLDIQRGTALFLVKSLVLSAKPDAEGNYRYDSLRITQLSGCLGIDSESAKEICKRVINGEVEETLIDEYTTQSEQLKKKTIDGIKDELRKISR